MTTNQKVAGSSLDERAPIYPANRSNSRRPEPSIRRPRPARFNCTANRGRMAPEPILAPSPGPFLCRSQQPRRSCSPRRPRLAGSLSCSGRHLLIDDDGVVAVADLLYGVLGPFLIVHGASYLVGPVLLYEGRRRLVELFVHYNRDVPRTMVRCRHDQNIACLRGTVAGTHVLIAAARYLAAHCPTMRSQGQTYDIARRLSRGEILHEERATSIHYSNEGRKIATGSSLSADARSYAG